MSRAKTQPADTQHALSYQEFLESKRVKSIPTGFEVSESEINPKLFPFQRDIVQFALRRGKSACFAHTGLGKGPIQMEWCQHLIERGPSLILAPLAVAHQFKREGVKFGYDINVCKQQSDVRRDAINVTNYDRSDDFALESFTAVAMDESSIIKDFTSRTCQNLIERLARVPYKICSTATPSPNEHAELGTHAELLDVMTRPGMLSMFFEHDGGDTGNWVLKGHGKRPFWYFMATWSVCLKKPSDLGYDDAGFDLPPLRVIEHIVPVDHGVATEGMLFRSPDLSATGLHKELRLTAKDRARKVAELVTAEPHEPWLIWCNTNYEADEIRAVLPKVVEVRGSDSVTRKEEALEAFAVGGIQWLLTKSSIAGFGMNYQHCARMAFVGMSYSWEQVFQAIRRCWRFGQTREVFANLVCAETEGKVLESFRRKERQYEELQSEMNEAMRHEQLKARYHAAQYQHNLEIRIPLWLHSQ